MKSKAQTSKSNVFVWLSIRRLGVLTNCEYTALTEKVWMPPSLATHSTET